MRPIDVKKAIQYLRAANLPCFLKSPPGCGKSDIIEQATQEAGVKYLDVRVLLHEPSDFKFPIVDVKERMIHWVQSVFPTEQDWVGIVALEEVPQAAPLVQASLLGLVLERRLGAYKVPDGVQFVATGNRMSDRAGGHRIITPLLNRFVHIDLDVSHDDWHEWAIKKGVEPVVRSCIRWTPSLLHEWDKDQSDAAKAAGKTGNSSGVEKAAFATPRSWEFVSRMLPHVKDETVLTQLVSGTIGESAAATFMGFLKIYRDLPDLEAIFSNPTKTTVPKDNAVCYALCGALAERCRNADDERLEAAVTYHSRMSEEFSILCMRDILSVNNRVLKLPKSTAWIKAHKDVFMS